MPYSIHSKVLDENGQPIEHAVVISELAGVGLTAMADVVANNDGSFIFSALNSSSLISVEAVGYQPQVFNANAVPSEIRLEPAIVIEGKTTPNKKDNTWAYVAAAAAVLVVAVVAATAKKPKQAPTAAKGLNIPVIRFT